MAKDLLINFGFSCLASLVIICICFIAGKIIFKNVDGDEDDDEF